MCGVGLEGIKRIFKGAGIDLQMWVDMLRNLGSQGHFGQPLVRDHRLFFS